MQATQSQSSTAGASATSTSGFKSRRHHRAGRSLSSSKPVRLTQQGLGGCFLNFNFISGIKSSITKVGQFQHPFLRTAAELTIPPK